MAEIIKFTHGVYKFRLLLEKIAHDERVILYKVSGKNKSVVLQSNEPFYRNRGIMHRPADWKLVEGEVRTAGFIEMLIKVVKACRQKELEWELRNKII